MRKALFLSAIGVAAICPAMAGIAQQAGFGALSGLEQGEWELKERGSVNTPRRVCIGDASQLLQPQHPGQQCKRFVLENSEQQVSVTYDCAQAGQGRTAVRIETARLVQIDSQGVSGGSPFALTMEGRKVGACKSAALRR